MLPPSPIILLASTGMKRYHYLQWNHVNQSQSSSYQNLFASRGLSAASNKNSILEVLSKKSFALRHKGDKITYSKESNQIVVQFNGDQVQAVFDLTNNKNVCFHPLPHLTQ